MTGIVIYNALLIPAGFEGYTIGPVILIRPGSRGDRGLLEHERVHVRQFFNPAKWFWSKLEKEVEAYREQAKWYPDDRIPRFAEMIATKYGIVITAAWAEILLRGSR